MTIFSFNSLNKMLQIYKICIVQFHKVQAYLRCMKHIRIAFQTLTNKLIQFFLCYQVFLLQSNIIFDFCVLRKMSLNYLRNLPSLTKRNLSLQTYSRLHQQAATAGSFNQQEFDRSIYFLSKLDKDEPVYKKKTLTYLSSGISHK